MPLYENYEKDSDTIGEDDIGTEMVEAPDHEREELVL